MGLQKDNRTKKRRWGGTVNERRGNKKRWIEREGINWLGEEGMCNGPHHSCWKAHLAPSMSSQLTGVDAHTRASSSGAYTPCLPRVCLHWSWLRAQCSGKQPSTKLHQAKELKVWWKRCGGIYMQCCYMCIMIWHACYMLPLCLHEVMMYDYSYRLSSENHSSACLLR